MLNLPRCSTFYNIAGTKYYRLGSRKIECLDERGTNMQNWEKGLRRLFCADSGYVLIQGDQAGAEAVIVAYLCRMGRFRELVLNKIKHHTFAAMHLFPEIWQKKMNEGRLDIKFNVEELLATPIPLLNKNPFWKPLSNMIKESDNWIYSERYYFIAKQVVHSSNYGITAGMLCLNILDKSGGKIVVKTKRGEQFLTVYHTLFPEIREWHQEVEEMVRTTRMLFNLFGYPIQFTGALKRAQEIKEAFSSIPQSTVACINRQAFVQMYEYIQSTKCDWHQLQDNHDSILTECPDSEEDSMQCARVTKQFLEPKLKNFRGEEFQMGSELARGYNWSPASDKNPRGLKEIKV